MTTDNKTLAVDVLKILDDAEEVLRSHHFEAIPDDLQLARAAVAQLIEAMDELVKHASGCEALLRVAETETLSNAKIALARVKGD